MMWKPDRSSHKPIYQQIAEYMERRIAYGEYPPGSVLPSERKLAEQLGVNRSTVVQAFEQLRASGFVESFVGSGTRVCREIWGKAARHSPNWRYYLEGGTFLPNLPLVRRIREVMKQGAPFIDFASGELASDLFPNETFRKIWQEKPYLDHLGYDDPQGYGLLRDTLISFLERFHHIHATASSILITSGSQQSLFLITQCLLSPGDAVAIENPSYCYSLPMFQSAGLRLFPLPVDEEGINPEDVLALHREHRIRMIFINPNYQNPTGTVLSHSRRLKLLEIATDLGIPIVEDDPFSLTAFDGHPPQTLKSLDTSGTVIYIGSLSKIAASGFRIGWMIAPQEVVSRLADARQQMDFGLSVIPQWIAAQLLDSGYFENHITMLRQALSRRLNNLIKAIEQYMPGELMYTPPPGGLCLWCRITRPVDDFKLLSEGIHRGVLFMPGSVYGSKQGFVRFSFARPKEEEVELGISKFGELLRDINMES